VTQCKKLLQNFVRIDSLPILQKNCPLDQFRVFRVPTAWMGPMGPTKVRGLATGSEFSSTQVTQLALQPALMALMIFMGESGCAGCACRPFVYSTYYKYLQIWTAKVTSRRMC
jgi:hypothetical protein